MDLIGKTTIHPILFYTGKISGYLTWIIPVLKASDILVFGSAPDTLQLYFSGILASGAFLLITVSLINLGKSTRLGLPTDDTRLKTTGLYQYSRNPMYVGFNLLTISSIICIPNLLIIVPGLYSIFVYHLIVKAEEQFLENRFGEEFKKYRKKTHRYL